jgi:uncharacterized protein DUF4157
MDQDRIAVVAAESDASETPAAPATAGADASPPPPEDDAGSPRGVDDAAVRDALLEHSAMWVDDIPHRAKMEAVFGVDLGGLRVQTGRDDLRAGLGAHAASIGGDAVLFAETDPSPARTAPELTHTLQHRRTSGAREGIAPPGDASELEAEAIAACVEAGAPGSTPVRVSAAPSAQVQLERDRGSQVTTPGIMRSSRSCHDR